MKMDGRLLEKIKLDRLDLFGGKGDLLESKRKEEKS
jgi:hypothetical protein